SCVCFTLHLFLRSFYVFFLVLRLPPRFTLFPYTTLFRSMPSWKKVRCTRRSTVEQRGRGSETCATSACPTLLSPGINFSTADRIDRKSTRLNSSHVKISYAVFCLKKKKKTTNMTEQTRYE